MAQSTLLLALRRHSYVKLILFVGHSLIALCVVPPRLGFPRESDAFRSQGVVLSALMQAWYGIRKERTRFILGFFGSSVILMAGTWGMLGSDTFRATCLHWK